MDAAAPERDFITEFIDSLSNEEEEEHEQREQQNCTTSLVTRKKSLIFGPTLQTHLISGHRKYSMQKPVLVQQLAFVTRL